MGFNAMSRFNAINRLRSEHERDEANCLKWWAETSSEDKQRVWDAIQALGGNPINELISRFAQYGMTHAALQAEK
jgi:hypothetical protein